MKKIMYSITSVMLLLVYAACSDDDPAPEPTIVTTMDLAFEIEENPEMGALIGDLVGSSNMGSVTYDIASQTPQGAVAIGGANNSSLVVADVSVFNAMENPEITLVVNVSRDAVTEQSNVVITVTSFCPMVDFSVFNTMLNIRTGFEGELVDNLGTNFEGQGGECGVYTITGDDPLGAPDDNDVIELNFFPSVDDPGVGTVAMDITYGIGDGLGNYVGQGTYDSNTGIIEMTYAITFESDGFVEEDNIIEINIAANNIPDPDPDPDPQPATCNPEIDLSVFNSMEVTITSGITDDATGETTEVDVDGTFTATVEECVLTLTGDDFFGLSDENTTDLELILRFGDAFDPFTFELLEGTFEAFPQDGFLYGDLDDFFLFANFVDGSNQITIDFSYFDENGDSVLGKATITVPMN